MSAVNTVLCVEDNFVSAKCVRRIFQTECPDLDFVVVADAVNAQKVFSGEPFLEWDLDGRRFVERRAVSVWGVVWDNQFPAQAGERPEEDMGIRLATGIAASEKVSAAVRRRFSVSSGDPPAKFASCSCFTSVLPKPISIQDVRSLIKLWRSEPSEEKGGAERG